MLIEKVVFNFYEVGEKSFEEIKNECLSSFASNLKEALTSDNERIRKFWLDKSLRYNGQESSGSISNYKIFSDLFGSKIKYNSKSIVFEETITNDPNKAWNVKRACADCYGLEYVGETEECSGYYRYRSLGTKTKELCKCTEFVGDRRPEAEEAIRNFDEAFGVGEFPFITISIIRLGNKDHYFYNIHR